MPVEVRFVLTPFLPLNQPALGVSSLAATLETAGYSAGVTYLNLDYVRRVGESAYLLLAKFSQVTLLGEVIFARALWGDQARPFDDYWHALGECLDKQADAFLTGGEWKSVRAVMAQSRNLLERLYETSPALVNDWAQQLFKGQPRLIGLSSSFHQNVASLAVAQAVRRLDAGHTIALVMGGANCEGEMGRALVNHFPFLDAVVSGEAEPVIVPLVKRLTGRTNGEFAMYPTGKFVEGSNVQAMDELPLPKFGDFFHQAKQAGMEDKVYLTAESARGCWWGAKAHCKFCGLNGNSMAFRAKSGERTARELRQLRQEYGIKRFFMTDNILTMKYFESLLPSLEQDGLELFYEIKPNLKREHVEQLARSGVRWVQPGVESLDSSTLRLIAKGVSAIQNIQLLKWCKEAGIKPFWSILYGFPGEEVGAFERMAALCPALHHLPAPMQVAPFQLHRFSPYYFDAPRYGIREVRPAWAYQFAYPGLNAEELARLSYCFEFDRTAMAPLRTSLDLLFKSVGSWLSAAARQANLCLVRTNSGAIVYDSRAEGAPVIEPVTPLEAKVLDHLSHARGRAQALKSIEDTPEEAVESALQRLRERSWVVELDGQVLSVVLDYSWASALRETAAAAPEWM